MRDFRKIQFGYMDGIKEGQEHPNLLLNGYIDHDKVVEKAIDNSTFLFLEHRGTVPLCTQSTVMESCFFNH